ncbi:MAG: methyltransferase domain-containing protein [Chloroflexota bacterium]|nr:methyltransferase domain-containing protein [Chloroflexota bacterium]
MNKINQSYDGARKDLISFSGCDFSNSVVVDFGCYRGANARYLKKKYGKVMYVGFEGNQDAISEVDDSVDKVIHADLDNFSADDLRFLDRIDVVILGDVLEHLKEPDAFMLELSSVINGDTVVIVSVPNIQYYETFFLLLFGRFPRRERGIFDKTHLRWFTRKEFLNTICGSYDVIKFQRKYRLVEKPSRINKLLPLFYPLVLLLAPYFTFQMHFALKRRG